jgi:DNA-binding winged helix-turn-helix (wHTH) protein
MRAVSHYLLSWRWFTTGEPIMQVRFGNFVLDTDTRELLRESRPVHLSPKAFQLLELLVETRPKALPKDTLYTLLWPNTFVVEANLSNLVGEVRAALDDNPRQPKFVRTVHGFGYAFSEGPQSEGVAIQPSRGVLFRLVWEQGRATFGEGEHVLGRDPALEVCLESSSVSRRHARLHIADGVAMLEDLGSKNGTFVNGQKISTAMRLSDRDQIGVGEVRLRFRILSGQPSTETMGRD